MTAPHPNGIGGIIADKREIVEGILQDALRRPIPWSVAHAAYVERWELVRDVLDELLEEFAEERAE